MSQWPHLKECPENFEDFSDIIMVVGGQRIPAHSQYLAGHSKLMQNLMRDSLPFSKVKPLILDQQLQGFAACDLQSFLNQVYLSPVITSATEAHALLRLADFFEAAKLMAKAVAYLEEAATDDLSASDDAVLTWLLLAERFNLKSVMKRSSNLAAIQYAKVCQDARFSQLGVAALKAVVANLHTLADVYPAVLSQAPVPKASVLHALFMATVGLDRVVTPFGYEPLPEGVAAYVTPTVAQIAESELHVQQSYKCKASVGYVQETKTFEKPKGNGYTVCPGHVGTWDWNWDKQTWELNSDPNIVTKVLPSNVLDLATLLGSLPTHQGDSIGERMRW